MELNCGVPDPSSCLIAEIRGIGVIGAAFAAQHFAGMKRIGNHSGAAVPARGAQVMQPLQVAALALPVPDGIINKLSCETLRKSVIGNTD